MFGLGIACGGIGNGLTFLFPVVDATEYKNCLPLSGIQNIMR